MGGHRVRKAIIQFKYMYIIQAIHLILQTFCSYLFEQ